jgi:hypothetical protein
LEKWTIPYYLKELFLTYNIEFLLKPIICQMLGSQAAVQEEQSVQEGKFRGKLQLLLYLMHC